MKEKVGGLMSSLATKFKLGIYKQFGKSVEFKRYLHVSSEELGRHRGRDGKTECSLCVNECENMSHVLWECSAYSN